MGLLEAVHEFIGNINAGVYAIVISGLYILINILRGKAGFDVPFLTKAWNKIKNKHIKTSIIMGLFALVGGITTLQEGNLGFWNFIHGMVGGIIVGWSVLGVRHQSKAAMESKTAKMLKDKIMAVVKKREEKDEN